MPGHDVTNMILHMMNQTHNELVVANPSTCPDVQAKCSNLRSLVDVEEAGHGHGDACFMSLL